MQNNSISQLSIKMPQGVSALFFIMLLVSVSFGVLYSSLILYATSYLHMNDLTAASLVATFITFNYALHLLGGYIGGRFFSFRTLLIIGASLQIVGCLLLSMATLDSLFWGLGAFVLGTGVNSTCINCLTTQLFLPTDLRREKAFMWIYSGMNVGSIIGFSLGGFFQKNHNYALLFLVCAAVTALIIIFIFSNWKNLADRNTQLSTFSPQKFKRQMLFGSFLLMVLIFALHWIFGHSHMSGEGILLLATLTLVFLLGLAIRQKNVVARKKMLAYFILIIFVVFFWMVYFVGPIGLMLFVARNVDRQVGDFLIMPQWLANVSTPIVICAPLMGLFFAKLRSRGFTINVPLQFSCAFILIGCAYIFLTVGIKLANAQGYTNMFWVVACYIFQSLAELFIVPIGYAMIGQLAPKNLQGILMGTWMLNLGVGVTLSGIFSKTMLPNLTTQDPLVTNHYFAHSFAMFGWGAVAIGFLLMLLIPFLSKLMHETATQVVS